MRIRMSSKLLRLEKNLIDFSIYGLFDAHKMMQLGWLEVKVGRNSFYFVLFLPIALRFPSAKPF